MTNRLVTLVSGGLDSTLMSMLAKEQDFEIFPLFIDYGQRASKREWQACVDCHKKLSLPKPTKMIVSGFGKIIRSGLTDSGLRIKEDAFLPGRNTLFLVAATSYAYQVQSKNVAIGLLDDDFALFPDQTREFVASAQRFLSEQLDYEVTILTPLIEFNKADILKLARAKKIHGTYSCHAGKDKPCAECVSCLEMERARKTIGGK